MPVCWMRELRHRARPLAVGLGDGLFKLLATVNYDPEDEHWEFPPGSVVRWEIKDHAGKQYLLAIGQNK